MVASASTRYQSPAATLELLRYPRRKQETLQAWCSADTLLVEAALEHSPHAVDLVVNDEHGTLATCLAPAALWTDSALAAQATLENLQRNNRPAIPVRWSNEPPGFNLQLVLMRVPKSLSYFEYQLAVLSEAMAAGGLLICGGMDKHLSPQTAALMEKYFGTVTRHRGQRKARIFTAHKQPGESVSAAAPARYYCEALGASLGAGPNVFSANSLDIGSRFLIEQLPRITPAKCIADLACGNGVLGFCALNAGLGTELTLCDESAMAIAAARDNAAALDMTHAIRFHHGDGFKGLELRFDRILCNPPFHLGHTVDDFAGRRLLSQCAQQLAPGGELYVVANRHLEYEPILRRYFPNVAILAQNRKFIIWVTKGS
jgi:23S rRNA (guanine1835-N2)-methyltransferase